MLLGLELNWWLMLLFFVALFAGMYLFEEKADPPFGKFATLALIGFWILWGLVSK